MASIAVWGVGGWVTVSGKRTGHNNAMFLQLQKCSLSQTISLQLFAIVVVVVVVLREAHLMVHIPTPPAAQYIREKTMYNTGILETVFKSRNGS